MFIKVTQIVARVVFYLKGRFQNCPKVHLIFGLLLFRKFVAKNLEISANLVTLKESFPANT